MRYFCILLALFCQMTSASELNVVPAPKKWQPAGGNLKVTETTIEVSDKFTGLAEIFTADLTRITGKEFSEGSSFSVLNPFSSHTGSIVVVEKAGLGPEDYEIEISDKVSIRATSYAGAFYGTRTILQMLKASYNLELPKGIIEDSPRYSKRSVMLDVGRKFIPLEGLKDWVRMMAWSKSNEFHIHFNDNSWGNYTGYRLESKIPGLSSKDGFYTWKEIRELQDFAKAHAVEIVPEIDSPGHALAFTNVRPDLAHKQMNRNGFGLAYLDLSKEESFEFMKGIFDEIIPHFDSEYFHIGTDEYRINLIKDRKEREANGEHFRQYINKVNAYIRQKHSKTVRIWSGYEHLPGTTEPDKSIVIDMWETSDAESKSKAGYTFVNSTHFHTYIVPGMPYYGVSNRFLYETWNPRVFAWRPNDKKRHSVLPENMPGLLGSKLHIWNDAGPTGYTWNEIARLSWMSLLVMAENNWGNKTSKDYATFEKRAMVVDSIADVSLLKRHTKSEDSVVWSFEGEKHFIANSHEAIEATTEKSVLEYPWTAEFTLKRESETAGNDTLLTSDLATIYLDLEHTSKDRKTKKDITKRGIAVVRANQAPGYEPLLAYRPDVLVFNYKVPFNEKVTIKLVGEKRKTSLYVNGKLIESLGKQSVCPIETLGSKRPETFQGVLYKATIYDKVK